MFEKFAEDVTRRYQEKLAAWYGSGITRDSSAYKNLKNSLARASKGYNRWSDSIIDWKARTPSEFIGDPLQIKAQIANRLTPHQQELAARQLGYKASPIDVQNTVTKMLNDPKNTDLFSLYDSAVKQTVTNGAFDDTLGSNLRDKVKSYLNL